MIDTAPRRPSPARGRSARCTSRNGRVDARIFPARRGRKTNLKGANLSALLIIRTQEPIRVPRMDARRHNVSALLANDERHTLFVHFNFSFCECKIKQGMAQRANHADLGDRKSVWFRLWRAPHRIIYSRKFAVV